MKYLRKGQTTRLSPGLFLVHTWKKTIDFFKWLFRGSLRHLSGLLGFFRNCPSYPFSNISLAVNNSLPQRPYMVRFIIFNLLFVPSTKPFDRGLATAFYTADKSFSSWIFLEEALKWKRLNCKRSLKTALDYVISNGFIEHARVQLIFKK